MATLPARRPMWRVLRRERLCAELVRPRRWMRRRSGAGSTILLTWPEGVVCVLVGCRGFLIPHHPVNGVMKVRGERQFHFTLLYPFFLTLDFRSWRDVTPEGALSLAAAHPKVCRAGFGCPKTASATCPTRRLNWPAPLGTHKESRTLRSSHDCHRPLSRTPEGGGGAHAHDVEWCRHKLPSLATPFRRWTRCSS